MEDINDPRERRKHPRISLDLPVEYRVTSAPHGRGALVINASESGLLVHSIKEMPVGTKLNIAVMFPKEFQFANFEVFAEVVWKDIQWEENWEGYQLGLKFIHIPEEDYKKLKQLLDDGHEIE
jgi:c-di-GMP-binding flagellar brake protein YcgR